MATKDQSFCDSLVASYRAPSQTMSRSDLGARLDDNGFRTAFAKIWQGALLLQASATRVASGDPAAIQSNGVGILNDMQIFWQQSVLLRPRAVLAADEFRAAIERRYHQPPDSLKYDTLEDALDKDFSDNFAMVWELADQLSLIMDKLATTQDSDLMDQFKIDLGQFVDFWKQSMLSRPRAFVAERSQSAGA